MNKLHRPLVDAVVNALMQIFNENRQADRVIEQLLKSNKKWGARDRAFIAENTYEIVRWWRLLKFVGGPGCVRIESVENFYQIAGVWFVLKKIDLPAWQEFRGIDKKDVFEKYDEAQKTRKIRESMPDWLDEIGEKELGEKWETELAALNRQAPVILRANTLKISKLELKKILLESNIETDIIEGIRDALILKKRTNVFSTEAFKKGFLEVQDAGSQLIAEFLGVEAGMRVVDACAGAGGKTLHLAALMQNKGKIIAMDVEDFKLQELKRRARRNDVQNVETRLIEAKTIKRLKESVDALLLDVPCSGLGVLRRNPDAKWKIKPDFIERIKETQAEILKNYSEMLKKGGKMVYATCSILPSESEDQVEKFLSKNTNFRLIKQHRTSVADDNSDGFYMALMEKM